MKYLRALLVLPFLPVLLLMAILLAVLDKKVAKHKSKKI